MSWGFSAGTWGQLRRAGGAKRWFEEQLEPSRITDPQGAMFDRWYPDRMRTPAEKWDTVFAESKFQWDAVDLTNWSLLRRSRSSRQLLEVMTDFWSNHLHIPAIHDLAWCWRNHYDAHHRCPDSCRGGVEGLHHQHGRPLARVRNRCLSPAVARREVVSDVQARPTRPPDLSPLARVNRGPPQHRLRRSGDHPVRRGGHGLIDQEVRPNSTALPHRADPRRRAHRHRRGPATAGTARRARTDHLIEVRTSLSRVRPSQSCPLNPTDQRQQPQPSAGFGRSISSPGFDLLLFHWICSHRFGLTRQF